MAMSGTTCYEQRPHVCRLAGKWIRTAAFVVALGVAAPWVGRSEVAVVLAPPAWPPGPSGRGEEGAGAPEGGAAELVEAIARHGLGVFLKGEDESACPAGGSIRVACRENGTQAVLLAEVASCRLSLRRRDEEASMTGELALVLPEGVPCGGAPPRACLAARVQSARLWATVSDRRGAVVRTAEVKQESGALGFLIPCPVEPEALLPGKATAQ